MMAGREPSLPDYGRTLDLSPAESARLRLDIEREQQASAEMLALMMANARQTAERLAFDILDGRITPT